MNNELFPIISKLGGRESALARMQATGWQRGAPALRMMISRRRLSGAAMRALMVAADDAGLTYRATDFMALPSEEVA